MPQQAADSNRPLVVSISRRKRVAAVAVGGTDSAVPSMNHEIDGILPRLAPRGPDGVRLRAV